MKGTLAPFCHFPLFFFTFHCFCQTDTFRFSTQHVGRSRICTRNSFPRFNNIALNITWEVQTENHPWEGYISIFCNNTFLIQIPEQFEQTGCFVANVYNWGANWPHG